jgi:hypothetical protein
LSPAFPTLECELAVPWASCACQGMGRITVAIEWALIYLFGLTMFAGLVFGSMPREPGRSNWFEVAILLAFPIGLALIIWQGTQGHLPGTVASGKSVMPFIARMLAWAGGLSILVGSIGALAGYLAMSSGSTHSTGEGIIVVIPATIGFLAGGLAGAIATIVKTLR